MSTYELAQLNIGIIRGPMDSPLMAEFAANLDRINALAESSPGFVWRLQTPEGNATAIRPFENENMLINMVDKHVLVLEGADRRGIALGGLQPPHETWRALGERVDAVKVCRELRHEGRVHRSPDDADVQLRELVSGHD